MITLEWSLQAAQVMKQPQCTILSMVLACAAEGKKGAQGQAAAMSVLLLR